MNSIDSFSFLFEKSHPAQTTIVCQLDRKSIVSLTEVSSVLKNSVDRLRESGAISPYLCVKIGNLSGSIPKDDLDKKLIALVRSRWKDASFKKSILFWGAPLPQGCHRTIPNDPNGFYYLSGKELRQCYFHVYAFQGEDRVIFDLRPHQNAPPKIGVEQIDSVMRNLLLTASPDAITESGNQLISLGKNTFLRDDSENLSLLSNDDKVMAFGIKSGEYDMPVHVAYKRAELLAVGLATKVRLFKIEGRNDGPDAIIFVDEWDALTHGNIESLFILEIGVLVGRTDQGRFFRISPFDEHLEIVV